MSSPASPSKPPSVWIPTGTAAVACLSPLINRALGDPTISGTMNAMLFVAGVAIPAVSLNVLVRRPTSVEKVAVALTCFLGGGTLLWVDWSRLDGRVFVVATLFFIPTIVRLFTRLSGGGGG